MCECELKRLKRAKEQPPQSELRSREHSKSDFESAACLHVCQRVEGRERERGETYFAR